MLRPGTLAFALTFALTAGPPLAQANPESEDSADEAPGNVEAGPSKVAKRSGSSKQSRRRKSKVVGHVVPDSQLRAAQPPVPSGHIEVHSIAWNEDAVKKYLLA